MKGIQYSTKKELYEAKRILYEGNNATKKTFLVALASLVPPILRIHLPILSILSDFLIASVGFEHPRLCGPMDLRDRLHRNE